MHTSTFEIISIILVMSAFILGVVFLIYSNLKSYIDELSEKITILTIIPQYVMRAMTLTN